MNQVVTYAIELDVHGKEIDIKNKQQHFLEIQNIESYYNIRTVQDSFQIMTSYLALDDVVLFPLSNVKTSFQKSGFKTFKDKKVDTDIVSLTGMVTPKLTGVGVPVGVCVHLHLHLYTPIYT